MTSCLDYFELISFRKVICSKRKLFAPKASKFFPSRVDPFQKEVMYSFPVTLTIQQANKSFITQTIHMYKMIIASVPYLP